MARAYDFVETKQLLHADLSTKFVHQFTFNSDGPDGGWRGEYWGKMMRGGCEFDNLFRLAFEDGLYPYQYPLTKAYELTSCFEGLIEYYRITGNEDVKTAVGAITL